MGRLWGGANTVENLGVFVCLALMKLLGMLGMGIWGSSALSLGDLLEVQPRGAGISLLVENLNSFSFLTLGSWVLWGLEASNPGSGWAEFGKRSGEKEKGQEVL